MLKLWIYLTFLCLAVKATFVRESIENGGYIDYDDINSIKMDDILSGTLKLDNDIQDAIEKIRNDFNDDSLGDVSYQIEDNRSMMKDENDVDESESKETIDMDDSYNLSDLSELEKNISLDETSEEKRNDDKNPKEESPDSNIMKDEDQTEKIEEVIEETKAILDEDTGNDFSDYTINSDSQDLKKIMDETKAILDATLGTLDDSDAINNTGNVKDVENMKKVEKDPVKKIANEVDGLMDDMEELRETWEKLKENNDYDSSSFSSFEENDYEEIDDDHLEQIFDLNNVSTNAPNVHEVEPFPDDSITNSDHQSERILYLNDDLPVSEDELLKTTETVVLEKSAESPAPEKSPDFSEKKDKIEDIIDTRNMTEAEIDNLLIKFSRKNLKSLQTKAREGNNPQRIWLSVDKPTVVTSPLYPAFYPTGATTDWILEGVGSGIEFNITDCAINGHNSDYLLIIPGSIDDSGKDGLLFSYTLNTERWYRFLDVDRMFIRFQANTGFQFNRGFSISARMLVSAPRLAEPEPEAQPSLRYPEHTLTLNLGGITLDDFMKVEEQFRQIVADMATMYINANNIDPGLNATSEVTQILSRALCFHNWPKYELCAEVRFGVPLVYEDDTEARLNETDLRVMWFAYSTQDPFAVRLRILGITEFQVPNDRGVMVVWLVIAGGVVISMAMLAFALWRFSCFQDYTRMPSYSDTDSLTEKRKLDMFPTPHQTLPPLYADADYRWADRDDHCKVDVAGCSNREYLQDDLFDIDSDEDVAPPRDRDAAISPRDIYSV